MLCSGYEHFRLQHNSALLSIHCLVGARLISHGNTPPHSASPLRGDGLQARSGLAPLRSPRARAALRVQVGNPGVFLFVRNAHLTNHTAELSGRRMYRA